MKNRLMKNSGIEWVGDIPEDWEEGKLRYLVDIKTGKKDVNEGHPNGDFPFFTCSMIPYKSHEYSFDCEALLVAGNGLVGFTQYYNGKFEAYQRTYVLSNFRNIYPHFLKHYIMELLPIYLSTKAIGSVIDFIKLGDLKSFNVALPPLDEQKKIAAFLDEKVAHIDNIIEDTKKSIENLKAYKQALITETVTKGLNPNVEMKDSGIDWVGITPQHWTLSRIKYVTSISRGQFSHRPRNDERYYNGQYPFIQTGDVARAKKYITTYSQTLNELGKGVSKEFPKGTLVMNIAANVGDVAILDFDSYFPDSVVGFVPKKAYHWNYLYYVFTGMKASFVRTAISNTQLNLNIDRIKDMYLPVTSDYNEQLQIAKYLDEKTMTIDTLLEQKETFIKELIAYKKSLIYEYVTGKKEVK